ncbi:MAG: sugar ABC transporter permease [Candidatus Symbiobacter sp.]|nr:sugar ABC transporter permease [Candidatus Symbiobacter sp.]
MAPAIIFFVLYVVIPIGRSMVLSLYKWDGLGEKLFIGFDNYRALFHDPQFYTALVNNFWWLVFFLLSVPMGLAIALFLNQTVFGIRLIKSLFFFPFVISQVVVGMVFSWFYEPNFGLLGHIYRWFGAEPIALLADDRFVTFGIIFAGLWPQTAYTMILYLTGLNSLRPELIEAARIDGAKRFKLFWHVILPQLRPASFIAVVVTVIGALRSFDMVSVMTKGGPYGSSTVLAYYMYETALSEYGYRMGYGAAIAVILFLIMMVYISYFVYRMTKNERGM